MHVAVLATAVGGNDMVEGEDPATLQVRGCKQFSQHLKL